MYYFRLTILYIALIGCSDGSSDSGKVYDDFVNEVAATTASDAVNCGTVEIGESELNTNVCVTEAFANNQQFRAIYKLQGIDSFVASAISMDENNRLYMWSYDSASSGGGMIFNSDPGGGGSAANGVIRNEECRNPELTGVVDKGHNELFFCTQ